MYIVMIYSYVYSYVIQLCYIVMYIVMLYSYVVQLCYIAMLYSYVQSYIHEQSATGGSEHGATTWLPLLSAQSENIKRLDKFTQY